MHFIIFDIDGTLADTKEVDDKSFIKAFYQTFDVDITHQNWAALLNVTDWGITEEIIEREYGRKPTQAEYTLMIDNHHKELRFQRDHNVNQFQEVPGANAFFTHLLQKENINVGIATGAWRVSAHIKLEAINLPYHEVPVATCDHHKSREEITNKVIGEMKSKSNVIPDKITYFGDGIWDYKTCRNLNINFVGIDIEGNDILKKSGAKKVFRNYHEIDHLDLFNK